MLEPLFIKIVQDNLFFLYLNLKLYENGMEWNGKERFVAPLFSKMNTQFLFPSKDTSPIYQHLTMHSP